MSALAVEDDAADLLKDLADIARVVVPRDQTAIKAHRDGPHGFDRALWQQFAELGWLGLLSPEDVGGSAADERAVAVVARSLGHAGRLEPFVASGVLVTSLLARLATPAARELLRCVVDGSVVGAVAWQPSGGDDLDAAARPDLARLPVLAEHAGAELVLTGSAHWVPVRAADVVVVAARDGTRPLLLRVDPGHAGVRLETQSMSDGAVWSHVHFDSVRVPVAAVLSSGDEMTAAMGAAIETATLAVAAELLGAMEHMVELTLAYLRTRRQFGRPIGTFQALQHRAVDLWLQVQLTEAAVEDALRIRSEPSSGEGARSAAVSSAKARASAAALLIGNHCIQMHGAIGFTDEYELGHYVNHALVSAAWLGNALAHTRRYARLRAVPPPEGTSP